MKKLLLSLSVLAFLVSCGSETEQEENTDLTNEEVVEIVEDAPKDLSYTSFDLLNEFSEGQEEFLATLAGNNITITNILFQNGDLNLMMAWGYNGTSMTLYSNPETGTEQIVDGNVLPAYSGKNLSLEFTKAIEENSMDFIQFENLSDEDKSSQRYNTMFSVLVSGDNIKMKSSSFLTIEGAEIIEHVNF
ncbi:MAG: hypothetical protein ACI857_002524 [Arenicella sp.]|jgi:hypothetical protein